MRGSRLGWRRLPVLPGRVRPRARDRPPARARDGSGLAGHRLHAGAHPVARPQRGMAAPCSGATSYWPLSIFLTSSTPFWPASTTNLLKRLNPAVRSSKFGSICCITCFSRSRAHDVAVPCHLRDGLSRELPRVALGGRRVHLFRQPSEIVVGEVFVAVLNQQVAGRLPNPNPDYVLPVLLQLDHHRREVAITREQDEGPDFRTGEDQLDGVDGEADVGGVFLVRAERGSEDQIDGGF